MTDERYMQRALELAEQGRWSVSPNPMVGCVVVRDGEIVGEDGHRQAGGPHAEVFALEAAGERARGATMYVTLEPCCHHGRTGPCSDAVIASGISRVFVAMRDPNELVDGGGIAALQAAGIEVVTGLLEPQARRLNETFLWSVTQHVPFVTLKAGMTLDGKLATVARESQWITSAEAREQSLALREEYDAVLVGSGTVASDDPRLTRRLGLAPDSRRLLRVVLDGDGTAPESARIFNDGASTLLFTSRPERFASSAKLEVLPTARRVDLAAVLHELDVRGVRSLLVEGGSVIHAEFIRLRLWQKMILFIAPMLIGGGLEAPSIFSGDAVHRLTEAHRFRFDRATMVGADLMLTAYPA